MVVDGYVFSLQKVAEGGPAGQKWKKQMNAIVAELGPSLTNHVREDLIEAELLDLRHLQPTVPENFYLAPLDARHAEEVFSCYFTRARDSFTLFSKCFSLLPSVGVFKIDKHPVILSENLESPGDKKDGELVSWLGLGYSGEIAYAYTKEKYWGFRLNRATTIYMSHKLQQHNHFCYGLVDKGNKYVVENLTSGGYLILGEAKTLFYCPEDYNVSEAFI